MFLSVLADRMHEEHSWIVLRYQARQGADAIAELLGELPDAAGRTWKGRGLRQLQQQVGVKINAAVVKVSGSLRSEPERRSLAMALARALRMLGEPTQKRGRGVMLAIDEAQSVGDQALRDLGMVAQTVAHTGHLPVAVALAGTPELSGRLLRSGTFLERMPRTELAMLTRNETRLALLEPANARGVTWEEAALTAVQDIAGGYPHFVQLAGYHAWQHAAPEAGGRIAFEDATAAGQAVQEHADRMFRDRWDRLGPVQRDYLSAVAHVQLQTGQPNPVATRNVAALLGKKQTELSRVRDSLVNDHHPLRAAARGEVEFAVPRFGGWLAEQISPRYEPPARGEAPPSEPPGLPGPGSAARGSLPRGPTAPSPPAQPLDRSGPDSDL